MYLRCLVPIVLRLPLHIGHGITSFDFTRSIPFFLLQIRILASLPLPITPLMGIITGCLRAGKTGGFRAFDVGENS
jgi:hypothetical protein